MVKRRVKKKPKRRVKRRQATVRTEPDRRPILGGGGSFSVIPANPFQESVNNMMSAMQQNLNNNVNTALNQMRTESQIMNDRLKSMQYDENKAMEQGNQLMSVNLKQKIEDYTKILDTKYGMMNQMQDWMMRALPTITHDIYDDDDEYDASQPAEKPDDIIDVNPNLLIKQVKDLLTRGSSAYKTTSIHALQGQKLKKGKGMDWQPLIEELRKIPSKNLFEIFNSEEGTASKAKKIVALIEKLPKTTAEASSSNTQASTESPPDFETLSNLQIYPYYEKASDKTVFLDKLSARKKRLFERYLISLMKPTT